MGPEKEKTWAYKHKKKAQDGENRGGRQRRRTRKASCQNRRNVCQSQIHAHCHCRSQTFFLFIFVYLNSYLCALILFCLYSDAWKAKPTMSHKSTPIVIVGDKNFSHICVFVYLCIFVFESLCTHTWYLSRIPRIYPCKFFFGWCNFLQI